jgi:hypothetical protein
MAVNIGKYIKCQIIVSNKCKSLVRKLEMTKTTKFTETPKMTKTPNQGRWLEKCFIFTFVSFLGGFGIYKEGFNILPVVLATIGLVSFWVAISKFIIN